MRHSMYGADHLRIRTLMVLRVRPLSVEDCLRAQDQLFEPFLPCLNGQGEAFPTSRVDRD